MRRRAPRDRARARRREPGRRPRFRVPMCRGSCRTTSRRSPTRSRPRSSRCGERSRRSSRVCTCATGRIRCVVRAALVPRRRHGARCHASTTARRPGIATGTCTPRCYAAGRRAPATGAPGGAASLSNVSVIHHAGKLLTLGEVGLPTSSHLEDLVDRRVRTTSPVGSTATSPRIRRSIRTPAACTSSATASPRRTSRTTSPIATARSCRSQPVDVAGVDDDPRLRDHRPATSCSGRSRSCST